MATPPQELCSLPTEMLIKILDALEFKTLLKCRQVCKLFLDIIDHATVLQYKIELAAAAMEDGPPSALGALDRLQILKRQQEAWAKLQHSSWRDIPMHRGKVWELYGGVLAQASGPRALAFVQLPSQIRGIDGAEWIVDIGFKFRDFAMDPSQDLLVLIQTPQNGTDPYQIHLRSLKSGKPHPSAPNPAFLPHASDGHDYTYTIQISGDYLGVLFTTRVMPDPEDANSKLLVWNWKTGAVELFLRTSSVSCFAFLTERHILVTWCCEPGAVQDDEFIPPLLVVVDFLDADSQPVTFEDINYTCSFEYPPMDPSALLIHTIIRSDPAPSWTPSPDLKVPFYVSREDRLFVITLWIADSANVLRKVVFSVPTSTFNSHIDTLPPGETRRSVAWEQWGPEGCRILDDGTGQSTVWVCYVYGMRYIVPARIGNQGGFRVYDFNQLDLRRRLAERDYTDDEEVQLVTAETVVRKGRVFQDPVRTSLPYRVCEVSMPQGEGPEMVYEGVMISEDSVIAVCSSGPDVRVYRTLTF